MGKRAERVGGYNCYTADDRAFALRVLDMNGGNVARTAKELGIPRPTLDQWAKGTRAAGTVSEARLRFGKLEFLFHFRGRVVPVVTAGGPVYVDPLKLSGEELGQLAALLKKARTDKPPDPEEAERALLAQLLARPGQDASVGQASCPRGQA